MGKNSKRLKIDGRTYRDTLDKFLSDRQLRRKPIAKDGSCLFRAVSEQVYASQCYHHRIRMKCVEYIEAHKDDFKEFITLTLDKYLALLSKELWGGEVELVVLSRLYDRSIVVYNELRESREVQEQVFPSVQDEESGCTVDKLTNPIRLAYSDQNHYDSVFSTQYMDDTAFIQGLLYTKLMEKVFKQNIYYASKRKLMTLKESDVTSIVRYRQEKNHDARPQAVPGSDAKTVYSLSRYYELDVVIAMSWTMHHNAALSLHRWEKEGVEQRDRHIAASIQFHVGNKCHFKMNGKSVNGEIDLLNVKPGFHLVRVYQSQKTERWEIPTKDITLLSSSSSGKQGKHSGEHAGPPGGGGGGRDTRSKRPGPVSSSAEVPSSTQSILGHPPAVTSSSVSARKSKPTAQSQQTEHGNSARRRQGRPVSGVVDTAAQQEHGRTKQVTGKSIPAAKVDQVMTAAPGAGLPSTGAPEMTTPSSNPAKGTGYSSAVKKIAGGPSGSLTSEGTEYDESSDEAAPEEGNLPPEPGKLPPAQPGKLPPAQPGKLPPAQPGKLPPAQPGKLPPAQPGKLPPAQPGKLPPAQPGKFPPAQPGKFQPGKFPPAQQAGQQPQQGIQQPQQRVLQQQQAGQQQSIQQQQQQQSIQQQQQQAVQQQSIQQQAVQQRVQQQQQQQAVQQPQQRVLQPQQAVQQRQQQQQAVQQPQQAVQQRVQQQQQAAVLQQQQQQAAVLLQQQAVQQAAVLQQQQQKAQQQAVQQQSLSGGHTSPARNGSTHEKRASGITIFQQANGSSTQLSLQSPTANVVSPQRQSEQSGPYLERQIPRGPPSQPQDDWPIIPEDQPPQNTMIYAAVMTNRSSNQDALEPPIIPSTSQTRFPYSGTATDKASFPSTFSPQHTATSRVTHPPVTFPPGAGLSHPKNTNNISGTHTVLGQNAGYLLPQASPHVRPQFQTNDGTPTSSLAYDVLHHGRSFSSNRATGTEIYSTATIPVASYSSSRSLKTNESATNIFTTVAAGVEMRNMLGINIEGTNPPIYAATRTFQMANPAYSKAGPITKDGASQTAQPASIDQVVQVGPELTDHCMQTEDLQRNSLQTQTSGLYVLAEDLVPAHDIQMESLANQLIFAVKYSLHCLSVLSETFGGGGDSHSQEIQASLKGILDSYQIEQLVEQASALVLSQQNFLRSVGGTPGEHFGAAMPYHQGNSNNSQPLTPQSADNITPQQEQHLQSSGIHRLNLPPGYPFMMPPPPPFLLPPHRNIPMYYPVMTHMPVPPPMGCLPLVPPMLPHQMPPPPSQSPGGGMVGEQEHANPAYATPDNAHHDFPMQDQVQPSEEEVDTNSLQQQQLEQQQQQLEQQVLQQQQLQLEQQVLQQQQQLQLEQQQQQLLQQQQQLQLEQQKQLQLPQIQPVQSSEMVAPSVYPIPMLQAERTVSSPEQVRQDNPDHTFPPAVTKSTGDARSAAEEDVPTGTPDAQETAAPLQKQSAPPQPKGRRKPHAPRNLERPPTKEPNRPGLPCRPSSTQQGSGGDQRQGRGPEGRHSWQGGRSRNQGGELGQRKATTKSKTGSTRDAGNKNVEEKPDTPSSSAEKPPSIVEKPAGNGEKPHGGAAGEPKKEAGAKRRTFEKRHTRDHTGSSAVSGPSTGSNNKSNHDETRLFAPGKSPTSPSCGRGARSGGALLDTQDFRWSMPSPGDLVLLDSEGAGSQHPEPAKNEWPDLSELGVSNDKRHMFSSSLKFVCTAAPKEPDCCGKDKEESRVEDGPCDVGFNSESVEDPFLAVAAVSGVWQSDVGDFPLTLSPSQNICLAQCTGDLGSKRRTSFHKH